MILFPAYPNKFIRYYRFFRSLCFKDSHFLLAFYNFHLAFQITIYFEKLQGLLLPPNREVK